MENKLQESISDLRFTINALSILDTMLEDKCEIDGVNETIKYLIKMGVDTLTIKELGFELVDILSIKKLIDEED